MDFLYYVPGQETQVPEGLSYAFEKPPVTSQVLANGPDGGAGILFAGGKYHQEVHRVQFNRQRQCWQPFPSSRVWLGWYTDNKPTPQDLKRSNTIPGNTIVLGDGCNWQIPIARAYVQLDTGEQFPICSLPTTMVLDESGSWVNGPVVKKYEALYSVAEKWWDYFIAALAAKQEDEDFASVEVTKAEAADWCCIALAVNYRISQVEVSSLGLLDDITRPAILNAVVDMDTFVDRIKKKEQTELGTINSADGVSG